MAVFAILVCTAALLGAFTLTVNVRGIRRNRRESKALAIQTAKLAQLWAELVIEKSQS